MLSRILSYLQILNLAAGLSILITCRLVSIDYAMAFYINHSIDLLNNFEAIVGIFLGITVTLFCLLEFTSLFHAFNLSTFVQKWEMR